ncbi:MAG: bifunctional helix-turn-helix transcriptional regulator/GNAT family N-acetyltransferase [Candidatus Thorarchaeota archaeon]|jgi:DNA-binding MarR family transcriptional regulator/N-acetylglutamate synthase-like GNAT family acetyltransferase
MTQSQLERSVAEVRRFNRFYTKRIGLLNQELLKTRFSLIQARIIFELAQQEETISTNLVKELNIDPSYLSRILSAFEKEGFIEKVRSERDSRQRILRLTVKGRESYRELNDRASEEIREMLSELPSEVQHRFISATSAIQDILESDQAAVSSYLLRQHGAGDIGWIAHRHGVLYAEEYGWDETFEALVADILVKFIQSHDPKRERIWIAEQDGERIGSIVLVDAGDYVSQLRLLLVEPKARGKGIGKRLIQEGINFSKRNGYKRIKLWTQKNLDAARHLYKKAGFVCISEKPHTSFGHDLIEEFWELNLRD